MIKYILAGFGAVVAMIVTIGVVIAVPGGASDGGDTRNYPTPAVNRISVHPGSVVLVDDVCGPAMNWDWKHQICQPGAPVPYPPYYTNSPYPPSNGGN